MHTKLPFQSFFLCVTAIAAIAVSIESDPQLEVGMWGNFCRCAVTHGFDDNMNLSGPGQDVFDERGFHMTLHVMTGSVDWAKCEASFAKGHEISSHSIDDTNGSSSKFKESWEAITQNVPGEKCITIAYPECEQNGAGISPYYVAGRNCDGEVNRSTPENFEQIKAQLFGDGEGGYPNSYKTMNDFADYAASENGWAVYCHHGIGNQTHPWATTNLTALENHLDYMDKNRDKFWVETFGNVVRYIKERDAVSITNASANHYGMDFEITDDLDDEIFNYPLTIRCLIPDDWGNAIDVEVFQNLIQIKDTIVTDSSGTYIMFGAIPDGGEVSICNGLTSTRHGSVFSSKSGNTVVRLQDKNLLIDRDHFSGNKLTISFYNLKGKVLARYTPSSNESQIVLPTEKINQSAFLVKISDGSTTYTRTFIPQL